MEIKPKINFMLIFGSVVVITSAHLVFSFSQTCFGFSSPTLMAGAGGFPLIAFSSGVVLFAILKKKMPTIIFFALALLLSCGYVYDLIANIIESRGSTTYTQPGPGFYLLLFGQAVMIASLPLRSYFTNRNIPPSRERWNTCH